MLTRDFPLKVKALEDSGSFTGLAAVYNERDLLDDLIEPGAFRAAIAAQGKGFPLLWAHRQDEPIGLGHIEDDHAGLIVHGKLLLEDPAAQRAHAHMKAGVVKGLSIGFTLPRGDGKVSYRDDGIRVLKEIRLHEISVVAIPAAPRAQITGIKALGDVRHLLTSLCEVGDGELSELHAIDRELRRLLVGNDPLEMRAQTLSELRAFEVALRRSTI
jgi:HK97 family phage prohead protease